MKKYIANIITGFRILCSVLMLFFSVFSYQFYIMYFLGGISDMIDGSIARRTNNISEFGARFDSIADFIFVIVSFIKFLPIFRIPTWLLIWILAIVVIRITNIIFGFIRCRKFVALHTTLNKITGVALFLLPLAVNFIELKYCCTAVCLIATISAIQERYRMIV